MAFGLLRRTCWWCDKRLSSVSQAQITTRDGYTVVVHHTCKPAAEQQEGTSTAGIIKERDEPPKEAEL